jgi:hypothetical protein
MGAGYAAAAAAAMNAIKASGAIVQVEPDVFQRFVLQMEEPLVVMSETSFFGTRYKYLTGYKGMVFYAQSREPLRLGGRAELVRAKRIWVPSAR